VCQVCDSAFARKHDLQRHLRSLHGLLQTYKCKKCDQYFSRFDTLKRHVIQQCDHPKI
jgi:uncharacterized Zn-finger protein